MPSFNVVSMSSLVAIPCDRRIQSFSDLLEDRLTQPGAHRLESDDCFVDERHEKTVGYEAWWDDEMS